MGRSRCAESASERSDCLKAGAVARPVLGRLLCRWCVRSFGRANDDQSASKGPYLVQHSLSRLSPPPLPSAPSPLVASPLSRLVSPPFPLFSVRPTESDSTWVVKRSPASRGVRPCKPVAAPAKPSLAVPIALEGRALCRRRRVPLSLVGGGLMFFHCFRKRKEGEGGGFALCVEGIRHEYGRRGGRAGCNTRFTGSGAQQRVSLGSRAH